MPSRLDTPEMPPRAAAAHRAISGNGRLRALRFLLDHPNSTRPEVAEGAAISTAAAQTVLADLEELGYVIADTPEPRNGRTIRYSADRPAITRDLHEFMIWTLSQTVADHSAALLVDVIRRLHGDDAVRIIPFVPIGHVSVELRDGIRRLYDSDGNQVGRDLPPRS